MNTSERTDELIATTRKHLNSQQVSEVTNSALVGYFAMWVIQLQDRVESMKGDE